MPEVTEPIVIAQRQALADALAADGRSPSSIDAATTATAALFPDGRRVPRSTIYYVLGGGTTRLTTAEALAAALSVPVGRIFSHVNGDPIGGA